ncbi:hypothetical protein EVAR_59941_1 [Eumeta japonica]|uniref:Uncharacterized protein n=1 Tax=Eumeta variegata TaxID=151549 RepID=A0A4C1ZCS0_EUMVA|nr:hypothetical protein EVAR_59941_1 [Eumeta japonica]
MKTFVKSFAEHTWEAPWTGAFVRGAPIWKLKCLIKNFILLSFCSKLRQLRIARGAAVPHPSTEIDGDKVTFFLRKTKKIASSFSYQPKSLAHAGSRNVSRPLTQVNRTSLRRLCGLEITREHRSVSLTGGIISARRPIGKFARENIVCYEDTSGVLYLNEYRMLHVIDAIPRNSRYTELFPHSPAASDRQARGSRGLEASP